MHIVVLGCGDLGAQLARTLLRRGHEVTVVDSDPAAFERVGPGFKGHTVVGIGFDQEVLRKAGVRRADALAAVTNDDDLNIVAARVAREFFHVPRAVARVYNPEKAQIYLRMGLPAISPMAWSVDRMAELLLSNPMEIVTSLGSGQVSLVRVEVTGQLVGHKVDDLLVPGDTEAVSVTRGGNTFLPTRGTELSAGDFLYLACTAEGLSRIESFLGL
jgi:trk system potassium uptake protein TrkA